MNKIPTQRNRKGDAVFYLHDKNKDGIITKTLLKEARTSGKLYLSNKELTTWPDEVLKLGIPYSDSNDVHLENTDEIKWWECEPLQYLDMSSNCLHSIPPDINKLDNLNTLLLQQNAIKSIPRELGELANLRKLHISHNKISQLPKELKGLKYLTVLFLSDNLLKTFPDVLYDLVMLKSLDLSKNQIETMSPGIGYLTRLTTLNLSENLLTSIPSDITNCRELEFLNLSENRITSEGLPELIDMKVEIILLYSNNLSVLPRLRGCSCLKEIHLGNNKIKEITLEELLTLSHLQIIVLKNNCLKELPKELGCLKSLVRLDLSFNDLSSLPPTLALLPHLEILSLEGNPMQTLRRNILVGGTQRLLKHLKEMLPAEEFEKNSGTLLMSNCETELPNKFSMKFSKTVNLASKKLSDVPNFVFEEAVTTSCNIVDLSKNFLESVPQGVWMLSKTLNDLNLCHNRLSEVPPEISTCVNLRYLNVANNRLTSLPNEFSKCKYLRELDASCNRFQEIPECIYEFPILEILNLSDNKIKMLDGNKFLRLKVLAVLNVSNNDLTGVPPIMGNMKQLRSFLLHGNGLRALGPAVLAKGTDAILSWLRDKIV